MAELGEDDRFEERDRERGPDEGQDGERGRTRGSGRTIRRALWGAGIAVAVTAVMVAVTLPKGASAHGDGAAGGTSASAGGSAPGGSGSPAVTENGAPQGPQRGIGPLTEQEVDRARTIALGHGVPRNSLTAERARGLEFLDADLVDAPVAASADAPRRVEVLSYDYGHDQLVKQTVDLDSGAVERTDTATGVQPPPSGDETRQAAALLIKAPLGKGLRTDFTAATKGQVLTSPDQLRLRGMSFDTDEQSAPPGLAKCGRNRCVRLFTQVRGGPWIDTTDYVVDLSDHSVGRIN